jgi:hypothetical protein
MNTTQPQHGFFDNVSVYFDQAASFTQHPKGLLEQIRVCNSVYRERGLRMLAEFDTYRRRTRQEHARAEEDGKREVLLALSRRLRHKKTDADHQHQGHDADHSFPRGPSSRGILSPSPLLTLLYDFAQIRNRPYLIRSKFILHAAWML